MFLIILFRIISTCKSINNEINIKSIELYDEDNYILPDDLIIGDSLKDNQHIYTKNNYIINDNDVDIDKLINNYYDIQVYLNIYLHRINL